MARSGRVRVYIDADASGVRRGTAQAERSLKNLDSRGSRALRSLGTAAKGAGLAIGAGLVVELGRSVRAAREAQKVTAQTEAVLKSTGKAAKVTAKDVEELANAISLKAGIDDEAIQSAENLLLTFKNIRNETGKGNQIFNQATQIVTDMSVALGTDLKSASIQVGKALNDPTIGLTALQRVGVTFTAQQKEQIQALYESGNAMKAQKMILRELKSEFGGSAKAQADPFDKAKVAVENLEEALGKILMPTLSKVAGGIAKFANQLRTGKGAGGEFRKELEKFKPTLKTIGQVAKDVWPILRTEIKLAWEVTKFVVKNMAQFFGRLVRAGKDMVGGFKDVWGGIKDVWRGGVSAIEGFVNRIIDVINLIPGVDIGHVGGDGGGKPKKPVGVQGPIGNKGRSAVPGHASGAKVMTPSAIVGEEAPRFPEYVLSTNPRDRSRNVRLWMDAAKDMGIPGFDIGGFLGNTPAAKAFGSAGDLIGKLPSPSVLPDWMGGLGPFVLDKAKDFIRDKIKSAFGGGGSISGVAGRALIPIGEALQRQGFQVAGHPHFPPIGAHTEGSYHYQGRAIDVNHDQGNEAGALNALYNTIAKSSNPTELFFQNRGIPTAVPDHFDHLHLAFRKGGVVPAKGRGVRFIQGGSRWSTDEAATLLYQVGASPGEAKLLSRKLMGESGGNPRAHGPPDGRGLFQIEQQFHPEVRGWDLYDPVMNAKAALLVLRKQGIGAWYAPSGAPGQILWDRILSAEDLLGQKEGKFKTQRDAAAYLQKRGVNWDMAQTAARKWVNEHGLLGGGSPGGGGGDSTADEGKFILKKAGQIKKGKGKGTKFGIGIRKPPKGGGGGDTGAADDTQQELNDHLQALNALLAEQNLILKQAQNLSKTQYGVLAKAIADVASGAIGGAAGLGYQSPSYAGAFARL